MKIIGWRIEAVLENGEKKFFAVVPTDVAGMVDEWLSEQEAD